MTDKSLAIMGIATGTKEYLSNIVVALKQYWRNCYNCRDIELIFSKIVNPLHLEFFISSEEVLVI